MTLLIAGLAIFIGAHLVPTLPSLRETLRANLGAGGYQIAFSLLSVLGLVLIVLGYGEARTLGRANPQLFVPPSWGRHVTYLLMLGAFILLVAAYVPSRIRDKARHPMLAAVKLWALGHLFVRGDLASVLLFSSLLAYAAYDRVSVGRRGAKGPLGNAVGTARGDLIVLGVGISAYVLTLLWGHSLLIGIPVLSRP